MPASYYFKITISAKMWVLRRIRKQFSTVPFHLSLAIIAKKFIDKGFSFISSDHSTKNLFKAG